MNCRFLPLMIVALALLGACKSENKNEAKPVADTLQAVPVSVITAAGGAVSDGVKFSGTLEEEQTTVLSFSTAGTITEFLLEEGQHVSKGQYIGSVDMAQAQRAHETTLATLEQAQDAYNRIKMLYDNQSVPEIKWVEVQTKLREAQSSEQIARRTMEDCKLYSPTSGIVTEKIVQQGQNVAPGMPVAKITGVSNLKARISVPESEIAAIHLGQKAVMEVAALGNKRYNVEVCEKCVLANQLSRSYDVKFAILGAQQGLMSGMIANVVFNSDKQPRTNGAVVIPANIIQIDDNNKSFVWTVVNGKAAKTLVECGDFAGAGVVIESGLKAGDKVIAEGQHKVCEGTPVVLK